MKKILTTLCLAAVATLLVGCGGGGGDNSTTGGGNEPLAFHFVLGSNGHASANAYAFSADSGGVDEIDFTAGDSTYSVFRNGQSVTVPAPNDPNLSTLVNPFAVRNGNVVAIYHHSEPNNNYDGIQFWTGDGAHNASVIIREPQAINADGTKVLIAIPFSTEYDWMDSSGDISTQFHFPTYPNNGHVLGPPSKLCFASSGRAAYMPKDPQTYGDSNFYILEDTGTAGMFYRTLEHNGKIVAINANDVVVGTTTDGKRGIYWQANGKIQHLPVLHPADTLEVPTGISDDDVIVGKWTSATATGGIVWAKDSKGNYEAYDFTPNVTGLATGTSVTEANAISLDGKTVSVGIKAPGDSITTHISASRTP